MSSKTVLVIGAIIILIALGVIFLPNQAQTPEDQAQPEQQTQDQTQESTTSPQGQNEPRESTGGTTTDAAQTDTEAEETGGVAATVQHSADGFAPETVTVQVGETVRFESSTGDMWVGVDEHPTHTQYDGSTTQQHCPNTNNTTFDQCETGTTYEFTFDKAGEWDYHNHVQASQTGTIVVEE
jgi:plastocyanin